MERLDRRERTAVALVFWPLTVALTAIVIMAALTQWQSVLTAVRNPFTWILFFAWLMFSRRALNRDRQ